MASTQYPILGNAATFSSGESGDLTLTGDISYTGDLVDSGVIVETLTTSEVTVIATEAATAALEGVTSSYQPIIKTNSSNTYGSAGSLSSLPAGIVKAGLNINRGNNGYTVTGPNAYTYLCPIDGIYAVFANVSYDTSLEFERVLWVMAFGYGDLPLPHSVEILDHQLPAGLFNKSYYELWTFSAGTRIGMGLHDKQGVVDAKSIVWGVHLVVSSLTSPIIPTENFVEPHTLEEFPPSPMTGYNHYFEGHGEFRASAGTTHDEAPGEAYLAFNKEQFERGWHASPNETDAYYTNSIYRGSLTNGGYAGDWIRLDLPYKVKLWSSVLYNRNDVDFMERMPKDGVILGSNDDGNSWELVHSWVNETYQIEQEKHFVINSDSYFKSFILVIQELATTTPNEMVNLGEWRLFGSREQGQGVLTADGFTVGTTTLTEGSLINTGTSGLDFGSSVVSTTGGFDGPIGVTNAPTNAPAVSTISAGAFGSGAGSLSVPTTNTHSVLLSEDPLSEIGQKNILRSSGIGFNIDTGLLSCGTSGNSATATLAAASSTVKVYETTDVDEHAVLLSYPPGATDGSYTSVLTSSAVRFDNTTNKLSCGLAGNADTATASTTVYVADTTSNSADHSVLLALNPSSNDYQKNILRDTGITFNTSTNKLNCGTTGTADTALAITTATTMGFVRNKIVGDGGDPETFSMELQIDNGGELITSLQADHITANNDKPTTSAVTGLISTAVGTLNSAISTVSSTLSTAINTLSSTVNTNATKYVHVYNSGFQTSTTNKNFWIPIRGTGEVANSSAENPLYKLEQCTFIAPHDGIVKKILFRTETSMSSGYLIEASFKLCKANSGIELPSLSNQVGSTYSKTSSITDDVTYSRNDLSGDYNWILEENVLYGLNISMLSAPIDMVFAMVVEYTM